MFVTCIKLFLVFLTFDIHQTKQHIQKLTKTYIQCRTMRSTMEIQMIGENYKHLHGKSTQNRYLHF